MSSAQRSARLSRRSLLRGHRAPRPWLPWSDPDTVAAHCTRCRACEAACPQQVIAPGDGGFPSVDARLGECTFCGDCAAACPEPVFDTDRAQPWPLRARVEEHCFERRGITCRACEDACPARALRFRPRTGGGALAVVDDAACTGCGACVAPCPADAVRILPITDPVTDTAPGYATR